MANEYTNMEALPKLDRHYLRFYVLFKSIKDNSDVTYIVGRDNDDLSIETNWNEEDFKNVLGEMDSTNTRESESLSVEPFSARAGDELFLWLVDKASRGAQLSEMAVRFGEVLLDFTEDPEDPEIIYATVQKGYILDQSRGGASSGALSVPYTLKTAGAKRPATFDLATETFTVE
jgi:hypothetical protein